MLFMKCLTNDFQKDKDAEAEVSVISRTKQIQQRIKATDNFCHLVVPRAATGKGIITNHYKSPTVVNINTQAGLQSYVLLF